MWKSDCPIDDIELDASSLEVPKLHAKYSELLSDKKYYIIDGKTGDIIGTTNDEGWYPTADKHTIGGSKYITEILLPEERETRTRIYKNEVES